MDALPATDGLLSLRTHRFEVDARFRPHTFVWKPQSLLGSLQDSTAYTFLVNFQIFDRESIIPGVFRNRTRAAFIS